MMALTGPVRQVDTVPTKDVRTDAAPHATVMALMGGWWPTAFSMAMPCPFCTTSTVMASGTTSSTIALQEKTGV